jgi:hypothetical protein
VVGPAATLSPGTWSQTAPSPALSPTALVKAAVAALRAAPSVHVEAAITQSGVSGDYSVDSVASGGRQVLTFRPGGQAAAPAQATIELIGRLCYVEGNAAGLTTVTGMTQDVAALAAGRWIVLQPGQKLGFNSYDNICSGISLSSVASEVALTGKLTATAPGITIDGQPVQGAKGTAPAAGGGTGTLYATVGAAPRLVAFQQAGSAGRAQVSFSRWGEPVQLTAPADPVPATVITPNSTLT